MNGRYWQDWVILGAAAWLVVSPAFLGFASFGNPAAWVAVILGVFLVATATEALVLPDTIEDWADIAIGFGIMGSPWIFEFTKDAAASLNFLAVGFVVTICAMAALGRDMREEASRHHAAHG